MKRHLTLFAAAVVLATAGVATAAWPHPDRAATPHITICPRPATPVSPAVPCVN